MSFVEVVYLDSGKLLFSKSPRLKKQTFAFQHTVYDVVDI